MLQMKRERGFVLPTNRAEHLLCLLCTLEINHLVRKVYLVEARV